MGSVALRNVTKRFANGHEALKNVTVEVDEGTMAFIRGHSGAGKTTLLRLLLGIEAPTRGQVVVNGVDIGTLSRRRLPRYRQHLGAVFQDPRLLMQRTVFENVALPLRVTGTGERDIGRRVRPALERVGLLEKEAYLPVFLSAGERQRVGIARAVVNRPKVLLADEPTGNLDPHLSREVMRLFLDFHRVGTTVIVASHDHGLIESLGMRVIDLEHGTLAGDGQWQAGRGG
ncbi:MAG: cell division ATP-binding protein FtsE [Gammaproteobacteria bacterium]|nr:cell division ATP-binding protein FtsE [Gammaproteobacteria bacterium]